MISFYTTALQVMGEERGRLYDEESDSESEPDIPSEEFSDRFDDAMDVLMSLYD